MFAVVGLGVLFGIYAVVREVKNCLADRSIKLLTSELEQKGVILLDYDMPASTYLEYLTKMKSDVEAIEELASYSTVWSVLLRDKTELYSALNMMAFMTKDERWTVINNVEALIKAKCHNEETTFDPDSADGKLFKLVTTLI